MADGYLIDTRPDDETFDVTPLDEQLDDLDDDEIVELAAAVTEQMEKRELGAPDADDHPATGARVIQDAFDALSDASRSDDEQIALQAAEFVTTHLGEIAEMAGIIKALAPTGEPS